MQQEPPPRADNDATIRFDGCGSQATSSSRVEFGEVPAISRLPSRCSYECTLAPCRWRYVHADRRHRDGARFRPRLHATASAAVRAARCGALISRPGGGRAMLCRTGCPERRRVALSCVKKRSRLAWFMSVLFLALWDLTRATIATPNKIKHAAMQDMHAASSDLSSLFRHRRASTERSKVSRA